MVKWPKNTGLILLASLAVAAGSAPQLYAATSATSDILSGDRVGEAADTIDIGSLRPLARPKRDGDNPLPAGNPLWSVPLSVLKATRDRPVFSASRRPPPSAVVAPVDQASAPVPAKAPEPERPPLALIGAVVGESDAIAVFLDRTNQKIVRLRQGESYAGWLLSSIQRREVTLKKADQTEMIVLQRQEGAAGVAGTPGGPGPMTMPAGGVGSYAPFIPRSTPKNGEPDGL
jgi:general secretion pathway protein N